MLRMKLSRSIVYFKSSNLPGACELVILDACRENPFAKTMKRSMASRSIGRGLASVEPTTSNTLIAFAAKGGSTAEDGIGSHSPFTTALLDNIAIPDLDLRIAFGRVRDQVVHATKGKQQPFVYGSLGGSTVTLVPKPAAPPAVALEPVQPAKRPADAEARDYEFAERIGTREAWDFFIAAHGTGFYANLARAARDKLLAAQEREKLAARAKPGAVAPERQNPEISLESSAQNVLADYMRHSEGSLSDVVAYIQRTFAAEVDHFGERKSNQKVVEDQRRYLTKWPQRRYRIKPDRTRIVCDKARSSCQVSGEIEFEVSNPSTGKKSAGVTTFEFRVNFTPGGPKIAAENGRVLSRRN